MAKFIKLVFASCLGVILATVVLSGIGTLLIGKIAGDADKAPTVKANTVLSLSFDQTIPEKTNNTPMDPMSFNTDKKLGLRDIVETIEYAKTDDNIKGIFLNLSGISARRATAATLRDALLDFKSDGKFITAYANYYGQGTYFIASAADKIYMNPVGGMGFLGFGGAIPFFKEFLDKAGIKSQVYYAGDFKSATEPYRLTEMSEENRLQTREYLEAMYNNYLQAISDARKISVSELRDIANEYKLRNAEDALVYKMVDALGYEDEAHGDLRERLDLEEKDKIQTIGINAYSKVAKGKSDFKIKDKIAVVYAEGSIVDGEGEMGNVGGEKYMKLLRKIRKDDKIKAVVMRVNSPGGSGLASDMMWRELELIKKAGKPVITSMGDLAASGGYYIACNSDSIFAEPNTITGSIGVFAMIPSMQKLLNEKVGVKFDTIKTGKYSVGINPFIDISEEEGKILQASVDEFYETFLKRVSDGRGMDRDDVHEVAQGRVWIGEKALKLGLVDALGGLDEALAVAADKAGLEKYRIVEYPKVKDPVQQLIDDLTGAGKKSKISNAFLKEQLGEMYPFYQRLKEVQEMKGIQARLPFIVPVW